MRASAVALLPTRARRSTSQAKSPGWCCDRTSRSRGWRGSWADGMITVALPGGKLGRVVDAFRAGGGAGKPMCLQVVLSFAPSEDEGEAFVAAPRFCKSVQGRVARISNSIRLGFEAATLVRVRRGIRGRRE